MEITLMNVKSNSRMTARNYYELFQTFEYTDERGLGFKSLNIEDKNKLSGLVVKQTPVFIRVFNENTQEIEEIEQIIVDEIEFSIDVSNKLIEIYASAKDVKKVVTTFMNTLNQKIILEQINLKPARILDFFKQQADSCEITKLHIKDFSSEKGVIGSYDIRSVESDLAWKLVDKYGNQIVKTTIEVFQEDVQGTVQIFQNGKFKISTKPRNNSDLILYSIRGLISENL